MHACWLVVSGVVLVSLQILLTSAQGDEDNNNSPPEGVPGDVPVVGANRGRFNNRGRPNNNNNNNNKPRGRQIDSHSNENRGNGRKNGKGKKKLPADAINKIKNTCKARVCKEQSETTKARKVEMKTLRSSYFAKQFGGDQARADQEMDYIFEKTQEAKKKVFAFAGLSQDIVVPADDGLWQGEVPLTREQVDHIIQVAGQEQIIPEKPTNNTSSTRARRYGQFFPVYQSSKWQMPVPYIMTPELTEDQKTIIRSGLAEIEQKSCVRFQEVGSASGPHIQFIAYQTTAFCGQSYIGNLQSENPVWLNFDCPTIHGTVIHEVLHALGFEHHQARVDREDWISIQWQNIDPQSYDFFHVGDMNQFSSFGVPYDYFSVMHYNGYVSSINGQPSMVPKKEPVDYYQKILGYRAGLSSRDAALVRKMYCQPDCQDTNVYCGYWANSGYCDASKGFWEYMEASCKQSCDLC